MLTKFRACLDAFCNNPNPFVELSSTFFSQIVFVKLQERLRIEVRINNDAGFVVIAVYNATASGFVLNLIASFLAFLLG
jgi:hypothetical protein